MTQKTITFEEMENKRTITFDTYIQEKYNLTDTETKLYGIFWDNLSKNCETQIALSNAELAKLLKSNPNTISVAVSKIKNIGAIECKISTDRAVGGQIRYISWTNFSLTKQEKISEIGGSFENPKEGGSFENSKVAYNISNISLKDIKDIKEYKNIIKQDNKDISDNNLKILSAAFENPKEGVKVKMSSVDKQAVLHTKRKRILTAEELQMFNTYKSIINSNASEFSKSVTEGIPRCLKMFKAIYPNAYQEKFREALLLLVKSSKWKWLIGQDPTAGQPNSLFGQTSIENKLLFQLNNTTAIKETAEEKKQEDEFANDEVVQRVRQKNKEFLAKLGIKEVNKVS